MSDQHHAQDQGTQTKQPKWQVLAERLPPLAASEKIKEPQNKAPANFTERLAMERAGRKNETGQDLGRQGENEFQTASLTELTSESGQIKRHSFTQKLLAERGNLPQGRDR